MSYIVVVLGYSRSGKDTLAKKLDGVVCKFSDPAKRVLEDWGGLPPGSLEQDEYRNSKLPGSDKTYLDLLIALYHLYQEYSPLLPKLPVIRDIGLQLREGNPVVLNDVRMLEEAQTVVGFGVPIHLVHLTKPDTMPKSSDAMLLEIWSYLEPKSTSHCFFHNSGTKEDLHAFAKGLNTNVQTYREPVVV